MFARLDLRAKKHRAELIKSFLERHGFEDVHSPRSLDESHRIQMKPVYPIEVASELGQVTMVNLLREAGASDVPSLSNRSGSSRLSQEAAELLVTADAQPLRGCRKVKETRRKDSEGSSEEGCKVLISVRL